MRAATETLRDRLALASKSFEETDPLADHGRTQSDADRGTLAFFGWWTRNLNYINAAWSEPDEWTDFGGEG